MRSLRPLLCLVYMAVISGAAAAPIDIHAGGTTYTVDPATLEIDARGADASPTPILPPLHDARAVAVEAKASRWHWRDGDGHDIDLSVDRGALHLAISGKSGTSLSWPLPKVSTGTWLVPDGEGMAYDVQDPFWRTQWTRGHHFDKCLSATSLLSFPAWSYRTEKRAVTYALKDGLLSKLCLLDDSGIQARLAHDFADGAGTIDLYIAVGPPDPLAPALFYRTFLKDRGLIKTFADKAVPNLPRLFGAPHAYLWGDGMDPAFLDDLKTLGIARIALTYDRQVHPGKFAVGPLYLAKADALGYLAGPYEEFSNGQPPETADEPQAIWSSDLYPSGCLHDGKGQVVAGFAGRGCEMSSEAIARHPGPFVPAQRYGERRAAGDTQVFVDVDAFGNFSDDLSPDHPMTQAKDRANRLARLGIGITQFQLVLGSENVTAWSAGVAHYSHGTALAHASTAFRLGRDKVLGAWWPPERPSIFFKPFPLAPDDARALFAPADRLPLFETVLHDSVVAVDRWELGLMKIEGEERGRFARSLLYGTPTMWALDRRELARVGPWLKAAHDDFQAIHGTKAPVALTGFAWLTPDRLVQQVTYEDGRLVVANFGADPWHGLEPDCVRFTKPGRQSTDFCPPPLPLPFQP